MAATTRNLLRYLHRRERQDGRQTSFEFAGKDLSRKVGGSSNNAGTTRRTQEEAMIKKKKSKGVKGESSFDTGKRKVFQFENTPLPVKDYDGQLLPGWSIEKKAGKGTLPYLAGKVEILNSASKKGGKNRTCRHRFFLNTTVGEGKKCAHVDIADQVVAYTKAIGARAKFSVIPAIRIDEDGNKSEVEIIDPDKLLKFIENTAGTKFKFRSKNEPSNKPGDTTLWPAIDRFIEGSGEDEEEDEDEEESDEDEDEDESDEEDEDEEDSEEEEEEEDSEDEDDEDEEDSDEEDEDEDEDEDEEEDSDDEDEDSDDEDEEEEEAPKKKKKAVKKKIVKKKSKK